MATDSLTVKLVQALETYTDEVAAKVTKAVEDVGKQSLGMVKGKAPRKTGKYKRSLTVEITNKDGAAGFQVYAKPPHERLTHLLESGHKTRLKTGQYGTKAHTSPQPHFAPVQEWADKEILKRVEEAIKK